MTPSLKRALDSKAKQNHLPTSTLSRLALLRFLDQPDPIPVQPLDESLQPLDSQPTP